MTLVMKSADYHRSTQQLPFMLESAQSLCKSKYINWENTTKLKISMLHEDYITECHPSSFPVTYHSMFSLHPWFVPKGKAILLQAWTGSEGSRRSRLPDFKTNDT